MTLASTRSKVLARFAPCACAVAAVLVAPAQSAPQSAPTRSVLFTFDGSAEGWVAGGPDRARIDVGTTPDAPFGEAALHVASTGPGTSVMVLSPLLAPDASWRSRPLDAVSFWISGAGAPRLIDVRVFYGDARRPDVLVASVPAPATGWRRFSFPLSAFWSSKSTRPQLRDVLRIGFSARGALQFAIDEIAFHERLRPLADENDVGIHVNVARRFFALVGPAALRELGAVGAAGARGARLCADRVPGPLEDDPRRTCAGSRASAWVPFTGGRPRSEAWIPLDSAPGARTGSLRVRIARDTGRRRPSLAERRSGDAPDLPLPAHSIAITAPVLDEGPPRRPAVRLGLVPAPKEARLGEDRFALPSRATVRVLRGGALASPVALYAAGELARWFGTTVSPSDGPDRVRAPGPASDPLVISIARPDVAVRVDALFLEGVRTLPAQGYVLKVDRRGIMIGARECAGLRYGVISAISWLRSEGGSGGSAAGARQIRLRDWPDTLQRGAMIMLPTSRWGDPRNAPVPVDFFIDFLRRTVVEQKLNLVCLAVLSAMRLDSVPGVAGPAAYTKGDVRRIVDFLRTHEVEIVPLINVLGHADWLIAADPDLAEPGSTQTLCARHPRLRGVLNAVVDEIVEVFHPRRIHFGLDEVTWPDRSSCPHCRDVAPATLFEEHVLFLEREARRRGLTMMMWADMVVAGHNGGPPDAIADVLPRVPRTIVLCDWSFTRVPLALSSLSAQGFAVLKSNSRGLRRDETRVAAGCLWGGWGRTPWLSESTLPTPEYSFLGLVLAAEASWNAWDDPVGDQPPLDAVREKRFRAHLARLATPPLPHAGPATVIDPGSGDRAIIGPVAAIEALVTLEGGEGLRDLLRQPAHWCGVPVGSFVLRDGEGRSTVLPVLYGRDVLPASSSTDAPAVYGAVLVPRSSSKTPAYRIVLPVTEPLGDSVLLSFESSGIEGARLVVHELAVRRTVAGED